MEGNENFSDNYWAIIEPEPREDGEGGVWGRGMGGGVRDGDNRHWEEEECNGVGVGWVVWGCKSGVLGVGGGAGGEGGL